MPYYDGNAWGVTYTSGVTHTNTYVQNGRIFYKEPTLYRMLEISSSLKDFLDRADSYCSSACFSFKYHLLGRLDSNTGEIIDKEVFSKINSISESDDGYVILNGNQKIKLGKLIVKIGEATKVKTNNKSEAVAIEKFVDQYKSWIKSINSFKFKILKGEDIIIGYSTYCHAARTGMLYNSCMNDRSTKLLELYTQNEKKVELLTLVDDNDKIYGRAFLWKIDNKPFRFMDRIYGVDNYINNIFINYAKEQKIAYRDQPQSYNFMIYLPDGSVTTAKNCIMKVKLKCKNLKHLPYMDSLYIWNKWGNTFSTSLNIGSTTIFHKLKCTQGGIGRPKLKILGIKLKNDD